MGFIMSTESEKRIGPADKTEARRRVSEDRRGYFAIKRALDVVLASLLLVLCFPLMLLVAAVIRLDSPGSVVYAQERVGTRRRLRGSQQYWERLTFQCFKFRTMDVNADPSVHRAFLEALIRNDRDGMAAIQGRTTELRKLVDDPRVRRPGRLLRKLSLDELPQLWNVLRGDMSLVGPRPAIPYEVEMYSPWHLRRLNAQPGITGLQQITSRSTADFDEQVQLDLRYIDHQSLGLDFEIMLKTPFVIISTRGAA